MESDLNMRGDGSFKLLLGRCVVLFCVVAVELRLCVALNEIVQFFKLFCVSYVRESVGKVAR
jgi:hypothetical protein